MSLGFSGLVSARLGSGFQGLKLPGFGFSFHASGQADNHTLLYEMTSQYESEHSDSESEHPDSESEHSDSESEHSDSESEHSDSESELGFAAELEATVELCQCPEWQDSL